MCRLYFTLIQSILDFGLAINVRESSHTHKHTLSLCLSLTIQCSSVSSLVLLSSFFLFLDLRWSLSFHVPDIRRFVVVIFNLDLSWNL